MPDPNERVSLVDSGGNAIDVPIEQVGKLLQNGWHVQTGGDVAARTVAKAHEDLYGGVGGGVAATAGGLLRGATLGLSDVVNRAVGGEDAARDAKGLIEQNPGLSTASQIVGGIAPAFVAPESLLARTPAGLAARAGSEIAGLGEGAGLAARTAYAAGGAATEGALQNAGSYVSDVALGDRDLSAEGFVGAMGKGALYGGVAGGALSVASNGLIAARKLIPLSEQTPEAALAAETTARRAVKDSIKTSEGLEAAGGNAVAQADRETEQFLSDLEAERAAAMREARPGVTAEAGPAGETQVAQTSSAAPEAVSAPAAESSTVAPSEPSAKPMTWKEFTSGKMGEYMRSEGGHAGAMKRLGEEWKAYKAGLEEAANSKAPSVVRGDAKKLLSDWRAKYPEGVVDYDAANAAARKGRLAKWAEGFEPQTPEDEAIKAYFESNQDPIRVLDENGKPVRAALPEDVPAAVKAAANKAAGEAAHEAYLATIPKAADISESGTELMARSMYAARREAARALDDVYTAYKAGRPIVDIRAAATKRLTDQIHELAEARSDLLHSLAESPGADSLLEKLKATQQVVNDTGKLPSLGERILEGAPAPRAVDPDDAISKALGKSKDVNEDIASIAPKITRYEAAKAQLTEALGPKASAEAQAHAQAFREAQAKAESASARQVAQAAENIDKAADGAPLEKMVGGKKPALGGFLKTAGDAGAAYEALRQMGVPLPDPRGIPVVGPLLSAYLKAKIIGKMMGKFGGSFAATAESTIAAKAASTRNRIISSVDTLASGAEKLQGRIPAISATAALGHKLFDAAPGDKPYSSEPKIEPIEKMYNDRMAELAAAMKPGAIEQAVRARIHTSDPTIVDAIVAAETRRLTYLYQQAPRPDGPPLPGQQPRPPSKTEISQWGVTLAAAHDPAAVFERVAAGGTARPAEVECIQNCYPQLIAEAQTRLVERLSKGDSSMPYIRRVALSTLTGIPTDLTMMPDHAAYLQSGFKPPPPPQQPPAPTPTLASNISLGQQSLTRLDR